MSSVVIALFFAVGISGWVYNKVSVRTGSADMRNTLVVTGFAGLFAFLIMISILNAIS